MSQEPRRQRYIEWKKGKLIEQDKHLKRHRYLLPKEDTVFEDLDHLLDELYIAYERTDWIYD